VRIALVLAALLAAGGFKARGFSLPDGAVKVDEDTHEFRNCDAGMRIIELNRGSKGQEVQVSIGPHVALHQIQQRG